MAGFSYNGIHSTVFGVYYIPDENDLFDNKADFTVYEESSGWYDGGYYYGNKVKPREFSIKCFYEDVSREKKEAMMSWIDRKTSGDLVFDERPNVVYHVRPTKKATGDQYTHHLDGSNENVYSGTFTITFTAYDPFGYLTKKSYDGIDIGGMSDYCGIIETSDMPEAPTTSSRRFNLYNCGTEKCGCVIRIGGTAPNGLVITNEANMNKCKLLGLPPSPAYLEIDSTKGVIMARSVGGSEDMMAFEYSDEGYITLEPFGFVYDKAVFRYTSGTNRMTAENGRVMDESCKGKYVYLENRWYRITGIASNGDVLVNGNFASSGVQESQIVTMNEIVISGENLSLDRLEIDYAPRIQ